jgi:glycosyltransferase involved in cell wall biosynthesis
LRDRWNIRKESILFLFAGKFVEKKRPLDFVRALALLGEESSLAQGLMVGDGPLRGQIEREIARLRVQISLTGFLNQSEIAAAYAASDALVLPSEGTETWGLVVNEAMACGMTTIVSDLVGCGPDLVTTGKTGLVYRCADVKGLARCMRAIVDDQRLLAKLKMGASQRIKGFTAVAAANGVMRAVEELCCNADCNTVHSRKYADRSL